MEDMAIVYMVAGISSRFKGKIKQFAKIGPQGETLIEYSLKQALSAGFNKIIFIVGNSTEEPFKKMFKDSYKGIPIEYALQKYNPKERNRPWGTLDALCQTKDIVKSPFVVCNGDDLYGEQSFKILTNHLREKRTNATLGYNILKVIPEEGYVNRGIFEIKENKVISIKEILNITKENLFSKGLNESTTASNINLRDHAKPSLRVCLSSLSIHSGISVLILRLSNLLRLSAGTETISITNF